MKQAFTQIEPILFTKKERKEKIRNKHERVYRKRVFFLIISVVLCSVIDKGCKGMSLQINYKTSIVVLACFTIFGLQCKSDNEAPESVWGGCFCVCGCVKNPLTVTGLS